MLTIVNHWISLIFRAKLENFEVFAQKLSNFEVFRDPPTALKCTPSAFSRIRLHLSGAIGAID